MRIKLDKVTYTYPHSRYPALDNVSISFEENGFVSLIGPIGSGKSTLLTTLMGLVIPGSGRVYVDGSVMPKRGKELREHRRKAGMVFQFPEMQIFESTALREVMFGLRNFEFPADEIEERAFSALDMVGLPPHQFAGRPPFEMSGGEKRRLALASILALRPEFLLLDEPTAGLDARGKILLKDILGQYQTGGGSVILVTHDLDLAAELCRRVVIMSDGRILYDGSREVFYDFFMMKKSRLRPPELVLAWENFRMEKKVPNRRVYSISEALAGITNSL
ncbi:ATP-binding cassette domain-containing protein [bacterium]|nr:ATP-binding cassette domain-containing protein [FCB group bacterium]MBL7191094.1 ATP-binding cassette domain-containing protein [bacterium]